MEESSDTAAPAYQVSPRFGTLSYAEAYANRGAALVLQGRDREAERDFARSIKLGIVPRGVLRESIRVGKPPGPRDK